ncbi:MAG TPA: FtsX-like permease family protein [Steroidobacteraceae bacterium]|jgi:putative ABC transport system permease protein|nr:FtsX-like permease family protein [Steroidobacteraceae bacterium]
MQLTLIVHSLRRNKLGALLIGLQIALTLAIVCNSLSIIQQHLRHMVRPTGFDEPSIWSLRNQWIGEPGDLKAKVLEDLAALRSVPGVIDAEATNSFPMQGSMWNTDLKLNPTQRFAASQTAVYFVDEHGLSAFGVKLAAGRWFAAEEVSDVHDNETKFPASVIVTRSLAQALFPHSNPLGKVVYFSETQATRIIGIVEQAQAPFTADIQEGSRVADVSFFPFRDLGNDTVYVVRTAPGQIASTMKIAQDKLFQLDPQRVVSAVRTFAQVRHSAYTSERKASVILAVVCGLLLTVTALGVVGLTSYWVSQRTRYIGMRRALGARRRDILGYFHLENLVIAGTGALLGIALGICGNLWLVSSFSITRMSAAFICGGAGIVLALCQAAVVWPALRAASISPALAFRNR